MRKTALSLLSLFAASCAFAAFTETETDFNGVNGWTVSGSGSVSELGTENTTALLFDNATVDFDTTAGTTINVGSGAKFQYTNYSIGTKGNVVLNFKSGSTASLITSKGLATSADGGGTAGYVVLNVEKGYAGTITLPVIGVTKGNIEMNLHSAYALNNTRIFVSNVCKLNMSADQSIIWDVRNPSSAVFQINITNGANLFVQGWGGAGFASYPSSTVKLTGEDLIDGSMYFIKSLVDSFDNDAKTITLKDSGNNLHTISFVDKDGAAVNGESYSNFQIGETTIDGKDYVYATVTSIPEPATWAAIFGAIALGLAVYRRRK